MTEGYTSSPAFTSTLTLDFPFLASSLRYVLLGMTP